MAQITVKKNKKLDLTTITVVGRVSASEISNVIAEHNQQHVTKLALWDLTQASLEMLTPNEVYNIVMAANEFVDLRKGGKTAIVTPNDAEFNLSKVYDSVQQAAQTFVTHKTFRDKDSATDWLMRQ